MKRFFKSILAFVLIVPFAFLLTACGETKSLNGNKYVFSRVEVTGTLSKEEIESYYSNVESFEFAESTVIYTYGAGESENETYDYKFEDGKVYIKSTIADEYPETYYEISGKYLVVTDTWEDGQTYKIYYKQK